MDVGVGERRVERVCTRVRERAGGVRAKETGGGIEREIGKKQGSESERKTKRKRLCVRDSEDSTN